MARVVLLLGGNVGDTSALLRRSRELLECGGCRVVALSGEHTTEPWGFVGDVAPFVNQALMCESELTPLDLLALTQSVEREVGREREREQQERAVSGERYASRRIDIDMIFYGDVICRGERLTLPHPLMQEREFVLRPLVEIAPRWRHPVLGRSCEELLRSLMQR